MRIAIDASRSLKPNPTGTERYSFEIIRHLVALPNADAYHWLLYLTEPLATNHPLLAGNAKVFQHVLPPARAWTHRRLAEAIQRDRPDVLFIPAHVLPIAAPGALPPSVVTIHDLGYLHLPDSHTRSQRLYLDASTRYAAMRATRLIAVSNATAADLHSAYHVDHSRVHVVHEAAVLQAKAPTPGQIAAVRARLGLERPYALFIGTIQPRKNLVRIAQAYARLRAAGHRGFDIVLAGAPGWKSEPLLAQIAALGLGDTIHLPGYLAPADAVALLHGARFFCYPSLFEGFGLPVLEAQQAGVAVLTATNSSLPEVAGDAALFVDPNDVDAIAVAMLRLSSDEALRARLIEAGHENVKRFSWEKAAAETLAVLEEAARAPRK